jgi:hypothetical protein
MANNNELILAAILLAAFIRHLHGAKRALF